MRRWDEYGVKNDRVQRTIALRRRDFKQHCAKPISRAFYTMRC